MKYPTRCFHGHVRAVFQVGEIAVDMAGCFRGNFGLREFFVDSLIT